MYGTVARMKVKEGHEQALLDLEQQELSARGENSPSFVYIYRLDGTDRDYMIAVGFESKDAYTANAGSPEQHARYLRLIEHLEGDPDWSDGEIVFAST